MFFLHFTTLLTFKKQPVKLKLTGRQLGTGCKCMCPGGHATSGGRADHGRTDLWWSTEMTLYRITTTLFSKVFLPIGRADLVSRPCVPTDPPPTDDPGCRRCHPENLLMVFTCAGLALHTQKDPPLFCRKGFPKKTLAAPVPCSNVTTRSGKY